MKFKKIFEAGKSATAKFIKDIEIDKDVSLMRNKTANLLNKTANKIKDVKDEKDN